MNNLILTFVIGLIFGYFFYKIKIPGGMMVGAIVGVALLNILWNTAYMTSSAKYAAQIMAGAFIGSSMEKEDIKKLKELVKPSLILISGMMVTNMVIGFTIYFLTPLDLITSLMCCVPGGMTEIPIISSDMGADITKVTVLQFIRMISCIGLFPSIISTIGRKNNSRYVKTSPMPSLKKVKLQNKSQFVLTMVIASAFGITGKILGIPAGTLLFSMLGVLSMKLLFNKAYMPLWAKRLAQVLSGTFIGTNISYEDIFELKYLLLPAILIASGYFINCFFTAKILNKHFKMSLKESMLAATPAGATDMALISSDIGVDSTNLVVLQIIRLIAVISIFPQVIYFISLHFNGI